MIHTKTTAGVISIEGRERKRSNKMEHRLTFNISGSVHGPLSERKQPPLSAQVQVPPKNSGNSLPKQNQESFQ